LEALKISQNKKIKTKNKNKNQEMEGGRECQMAKSIKQILERKK
jgi:hypothetical protein